MMNRRASRMDWESKFAKIVYDRGHIDFFDRFLQASRISRLIIVSPWITSLRNERITLEDIVWKIKSEKVPTTVILRHPAKEPWNLKAVEILSSIKFVSLYFNNELHAKVYVCRCDPFGFALVSSANLSGHATRDLEIGVLIEGKGYGRDIIEELEFLGIEDLPNRSGTFSYIRQ